MVTEERKKELAGQCRAWVAGQTCTKAHRFIVGSCIACERDDLLEKLDQLTLVVGLTAFKHEDQRAVLQRALDEARAAIDKATA